MKNRKNRPVNGKVFRSGVYSTAILAAAILLAVLVNLVVRALPSKYTEFDLSEGKMYTLGDSSVQLAQSLQQDVTIYYLCETGSEDAIITKLLDHYAAESSHIHWEQKDPTLYPTFAAQYGAENASTGSLIVTSGEDSVVLDAADLYEYDYSDYYTTGSANVTFGGEKQITAAIYKLTSGDARVAYYYTTNHGEQALTSSLTEALNAQNITLQPLDLLTGTIPEDCNLLIINAPASDFASDGLVDEIAQLQAYLENGGKVLLMTSAFVDTPNLDAVMTQFGLAREPGIVVEGDADHALYGYPYSLFPDHASDDDESTVLDGVSQNTHVMLSVAQGITIAETDGVTAESLLNTTGDAYSKLNYNEAATTAKESGDTDGPFALAAWARNESAGSEVIWVGCPNVDSEQVYQSIPGNLTFLQSCAAALVGQSMLIDTKALEAAPITVAASTSMALAMVFVFVLPAAVLIAGAVFVLGGLLWLITRSNAAEEAASSAAAEGSIVLSSFAAGDAEQIRYTYQNETITLNCDSGSWTLTDDPGYHLDASACNTMVTALASLNAKRQLTAQPGEDYGLADPAVTVTVTAAGETNTFAFGSQNPVTGDLYVQKTGDDAIYTVSGNKAACFEQTKADLFGAFNPAGLTASALESVSIATDTGTLSLTAASETAETDSNSADASSESAAASTAYQTVWRLTDDPTAELDEAKLQSILSALGGYVSAQVTNADPAAYGFDASLATVRAASADGSVTLHYAENADGCWMMVDGDSSVYAVDLDTVQALLITAAELKTE